MAFERVAVVGAGAWGTALANVAARAGRSVTLIARTETSAAAIDARRENPRLPGIMLEPGIVVSGSHELAANADMVLLVVPAQSVRTTLTTLRLPREIPVVVCAKGIEQGTGAFMTEVIADEMPHVRPAILSGPSFAAEVGRGLPAAVTLAAADESLARDLGQALGLPTFRVYHASDVRGVEIGGATKNVFAIAAGMVAGRKLGASAAAALTTRGFAELVRFGRALGASADTLMGLSGLGDLILTCSSAQSRNYSYGVALAQGAAPPAGKLAEGSFTAFALVTMAQRKGVDMPIASAVAAVIDGKLSVDAAIESLLTRPFRAEGV
ncbi:MAG TPA: NAD(P)H-dependent glycerol-3-phosphate dehydrogenase [Xanthobacteraceae bacterium]|nr:NAD(P)H-dependent glycerol-3-phosphate dehydrogenase [Xanthobacteraceae bacterium]